MSTFSLLKTNPQNFTPLTRTPWAGQEISRIKKTYLCRDIPERVGESWEISTNIDFPSSVLLEKTETSLQEIIASNPTAILGTQFAASLGSHSPVLLKWIEANSPLSVQVHPNHSHHALKHNECGKPEAWFIIAAEPNAHIFVGFKEGLSQKDIEDALCSDNVDRVLHRITPTANQFIAIPPGCVHALGEGVLVAEPQVVLPQKSGKTWRISDWKRSYNAQGIEDSAGQPRELHTSLALSAINWNLPRGKKLEDHLIRHLKPFHAFYGDNVHVFGAQLYTKSGNWQHTQIHTNTFQVVTMWSGKASLRISNSNEEISLTGGESAFISASARCIDLNLQISHNQEPALAFFSLNPESTAWHF
jgi:mannose-6-phosphate isomerase